MIWMRAPASFGETAAYFSPRLLNAVAAPRSLASRTLSNSISSELGVIFSTEEKTTREENVATVAIEFTIPKQSCGLSWISAMGFRNWLLATGIRTSELFFPLLAIE
jgi:hypothetical protein